MNNINTTGNNMFDISNVGQAKYLTIQTTLNSQPLSAQWNLDCVAQEDYMILQKKGKLHRSCILDSNIYQYNSVWVDDWCNGSLCDRDGLYANTIQGIDMPMNNIIHVTNYPSTPNIQSVMYKAIITGRILKTSSRGWIFTPGM